MLSLEAAWVSFMGGDYSLGNFYCNDFREAACGVPNTLFTLSPLSKPKYMMGMYIRTVSSYMI